MMTGDNVHWILITVLLACAPGGFALAGQVDRPSPYVIVFGVGNNTPEWNQALHVAGARQGCSAVPRACIAVVRDLARTWGVTVSLAIALNAETTPRYAAEYGRLSLSEPALTEIGIDDYASQAGRRTAASPGGTAELLRTVIGNLKSANKNLRFGMTLYEDELELPSLRDPALPLEVRSQVDTIHLYVHYRMNGPSYSKYVRIVRNLFPNAGVIAGSYAYDRIDYSPCSVETRTRCSQQQELSLFTETLRLQLSLLKTGVVSGIEFYPGYFGKEADMPGWKEARICSQQRVRECIANTKQMHDEVREELLSLQTR